MGIAAFLFSFLFISFLWYEALLRDIIWGIQDSHGTQSSSLSYRTFESLFRITAVVLRECSRMSFVETTIDSYQHLLLRMLKETPLRPCCLPAIYPVIFFECRSIAMFKGNDTQKVFPGQKGTE